METDRGERGGRGAKACGIKSPVETVVEGDAVKIDNER